MAKKNPYVFFGSYFRSTSDVNILETVCPIYLKINVRRVASGDSLHFDFLVNRINRFRDIDVGSWPEKRDLFWPTLYDCVSRHVYSTASHLDIRSWTMLAGLI